VMALETSRTHSSNSLTTSKLASEPFSSKSDHSKDTKSRFADGSGSGVDTFVVAGIYL
jgi:hypothetical protein